MSKETYSREQIKQAIPGIKGLDAFPARSPNESAFVRMRMRDTTSVSIELDELPDQTLDLIYILRGSRIAAFNPSVRRVSVVGLNGTKFSFVVSDKGERIRTNNEDSFLRHYGETANERQTFVETSNQMRGESNWFAAREVIVGHVDEINLSALPIQNSQVAQVEPVPIEIDPKLVESVRDQFKRIR